MADNIFLGATDDAVITWMKEPKNKKILDMIRKDTYPDMYDTTPMLDTGDDKKKDPIIENAVHSGKK
jgi:type I site-specific restriction endonuclease